MVEVIWSVYAIESFDAIILQIENKWGYEIAAKFHDDVNLKIELVSRNPHLYKESKIPGARQAVISRQTSMLYEVYDTHILISFFFDNRQEPLL